MAQVVQFVDVTEQDTQLPLQGLQEPPLMKKLVAMQAPQVLLLKR